MSGTDAQEDLDNEAEDGEAVNISEWIAHAIADTGCNTVYGGHGGALVPLVNAVCAHPGLTWVCARNEHDAATMAAAHAKMTGGLGCVIATSGPGSTNLTTGLMEAAMDKVALLAITGMKPTAAIGYSEFQDVNQSRLFAGAGIEWSKDAASADSVIPLLRDAVATALSRRTCAHLAVPVDIQAAVSPLHLKHFCASHADVRLHPPNLNVASLDAAALTLVGAPDERQPRNIIAVGLKGAYYDDMSRAILDLAEALNAPVLTRLHSKGIVDEWHPLSFGVIGVHGKPGLEAAACIISTCDCVISIGVEDETLLLCNTAGLQIRRLVEIQPDAVAVGTRFNAVHTLLGNMQDVCRALTSRVETAMVKVNKKRAILNVTESLTHTTVGHQYRKVSSMDQFGYLAFNNPHVERRKSVCDGSEELVIPKLEELGPDEVQKKTDLLWKTTHESDWKRLAELSAANSGSSSFFSQRNYGVHHSAESLEVENGKSYCHPSAVLRALSILRISSKTDPVSKNAVVAVDVGDVTLWSSLCLQLKGGSRTLYSEHLGTMGYALNAAIAGILSRPVPSGAVVLAGDGGFQMSLQELATFQQMKRPGDKLLCIVFDNEVLGRVAFGFDNSSGCEMVGPDYVALAKAYGGDGVHLNDSVKAHEVVKQALTADGLYMIHVIVDPSVKADMATFHDKALKVMNSG